MKAYLLEYFAAVISCWRALRAAAAWLWGLVFERRQAWPRLGIVTIPAYNERYSPPGTIVKNSDGSLFITKTEGKPIEFYGSGARVDVGDD